MDNNPAVEPKPGVTPSPATPEPRSTSAGYSTNGPETSLSSKARTFHAPREGTKAIENGLKELPARKKEPLALFCYEGPDSVVGLHVARLASTFAQRGRAVSLFARQAFPKLEGVTVHAVGGGEGELLSGVADYTRRACTAFQQHFPARAARPLLVAHEWSTVEAASTLKQHIDGEMLLSLHTLERQRSAVDSDLSKRIDDLELSGVREARAVLLHNDEAGELLRHRYPECATRLARCREPFPVHKFTGLADAGTVKARYQVGPVDPVILYLGDMNERHGPDVLMKAAPAILRNHPQTHFVFVGDGALYWPMRVYARYLLLEHRVRLVGHVEGQMLYELIQAADLIVAPSREHTEWWPFQAAWAARRPVVATHAFAGAPLEHERDCVLVYPHESSVVWGVERYLYDAGLRDKTTQRGYEKLEERFGWNSVADHIDDLMGVEKASGGC
jgi:glycosyltransferase involved in cell wall biosynthesis